MNLKALSQTDLVEKTKTAIHEERLSTIKVLHHLREIERRRCYHGYRSLFELAVKRFGYSAAAAHRRISSMRLLKELPEFEDKIESGGLSLTSASAAQAYFKRSSVSRAEKIELLNSCINKSTREVEKEIKKREPELDKRPDIRYSTDSRLRMSLNISEELYQKLEKLKYEYNCLSLEAVIEKLADLALRNCTNISGDSSNQDTKALGSRDLRFRPALPSPEARIRRIPSVTKKIVIKTQGHECAYRHPLSGEKCGDNLKLEFDHIRPFSMGGTHLTENLRLLCSRHNKLMWHTEQKKR